MFAALSSHLTPGADALIVYIRMHTANNFTCPYLDVSMPYNKLFIMLLHFWYLNRQNSSVHPWCGMNCSCNHTQPLSLVLMAPDSIQSTKDVLVRLFCKVNFTYKSSIKLRVSNVSTHRISLVHKACWGLTHNECAISAKRLRFNSPFSRTF